MLSHVTAEPFEPFRIHTASGRTFDVRHPEFVKVGRSNITIYTPPDSDPDSTQQWEKLSLMLIESISPIGAASKKNGKRRRA
jgi:hypothetical protein